MSFVTSSISFGGYSFPASFMLVSRDQPSTVDRLKIPFLDGEQIPQGTRAAKVIAIKGTIGGVGAVDSAGAFIVTRDQAEAECNLMESYLESGYQALNVGATPARAIQCQKTKFTSTYVEGTQQTVIEVQIEFVAADPRWIATATTTLGPSTSLNTSGIVIGGSGIVYPTATFVGAYVNPALTLFPSGGGGNSIRLQLLKTMVGGDQIVIDCDPRNRANGVLLNGVPRLDLIDLTNSTNGVGDASFFPYLSAGSSNTVTTSAGGTSVTVSWHEAYSF
ncbi:MAG: Phage tail protein [Candidatus Eremiobacteraeota bacterium]|nr:Phage tail protein [Candidatus Eremiobacteraeota bacterium]